MQLFFGGKIQMSNLLRMLLIPILKFFFGLFFQQFFFLFFFLIFILEQLNLVFFPLFDNLWIFSWFSSFGITLKFGKSQVIKCSEFRPKYSSSLGTKYRIKWLRSGECSAKCCLGSSERLRDYIMELSDHKQ